jgi:hypothetical protein
LYFIKSVSKKYKDKLRTLKSFGKPFILVAMLGDQFGCRQRHAGQGFRRRHDWPYLG